MRRSVAPIYGLIFLETLVWIAMVPLAPTFAEELGLSGVETGMILASTSLAALVVALPLGQLADRIGARGVTIASAALFTLATLGQGLANEFWTLLLARGAFGLAFGALWGAGAAWLSDSLTEERRAGALAAAATVAGLGFTAGPGLRGHGGGSLRHRDAVPDPGCRCCCRYRCARHRSARGHRRGDPAAAA